MKKLLFICFSIWIVGLQGSKTSTNQKPKLSISALLFKCHLMMPPCSNLFPYDSTLSKDQNRKNALDLVFNKFREYERPSDDEGKQVFDDWLLMSKNRDIADDPSEEIAYYCHCENNKYLLPYEDWKSLPLGETTVWFTQNGNNSYWKSLPLDKTTIWGSKYEKIVPILFTKELRSNNKGGDDLITKHCIAKKR